MSFIDLGSKVRLEYRELGEGYPLIILHGFMGTPDIDFPGILDWLKKSYHVYAITLRGYGKSTPKPRRFSKDFYQIDAVDVINFVKKLKINKPHLVGYSDGGEVALVAATKDPNLFKSVVTWGAVGFYGPKIAEHTSDMLPITWITDELVKTHRLKNPEKMVKEWIDSVNTICILGKTGSDPDLIQIPVLMLLGDRDFLNPKEYAQKFVARLKEGKLLLIEGGHAIHQQKEEEFKRMVGRFLKLNSSNDYLSVILRKIVF